MLQQTIGRIGIHPIIITASQRFIALLESQESMLHEDIERISGQIHPIRQCPEDVLRMIFELAVGQRPYASFSRALQLSQVCKSWRSITLQMRSLWSSLSLSYQRNPHNMRGMLELVAKFGASKPLDLKIYDVGEPGRFEAVMTMQEIIQFIEDSDIVALATLKIELISAKLFAQVWRFTNLPSIHMRKMRISGHNGPRSGTICDYWTVLQLFPRLEELELAVIGEVTIEGSPSRSLLRHLHFDFVSIKSFPSQMARFQVLEELWLEEAIITSNSWHNVLTIPTLRRLLVLKTDRFEWNKLSTPLLQTLVMDDESAMAADFICRHPSIQQLNAVITEEKIQRFRDIFTHLTVLTLRRGRGGLSLEHIETLLSGSFPKLEDLKVQLSNHAKLSMESFEKIVLRLCALPQVTNSISPAPRSVRYLRISGQYDRMTDPPAPWRQSDLMKYFHQSIEQNWMEGTIVILRLK